MATPKLFSIVKNRKLLNATVCSAARCKEPVHGNCPGELWNDAHEVALCAKHMVLALEYAKYQEEHQPTALAVVPPSEIEGVQVAPTWQQRALEVITWIQSLQQQAEVIATSVRGHVIQSQQDMEEAGEQLRAAKGTRNDIKRYEDEVTAPLKAVLKRIAELTAPSKKAWEQAEGLLRGLLSQAALAEQERNRKLAEEAAQAHAAGQNVTVTVGQMTTSTDLQGITVRRIWNPVVQDVLKLPDEYVERRPNMLKLREYAASFKGSEPTPLPGVSFVQDAPLSVRGT
jgi:hypothetical protein